MVTLPRHIRNLLDEPSIGHLAVSGVDGPHVTPVWLDREGDLVLVNSEEGREKIRALRRDSRVALSVTHPEDPYKRAVFFGRVVEFRYEGARAHLDKQARKYLGVPSYPNEVRRARVILVIKPDRLARDNMPENYPNGDG